VNASMPEHQGVLRGRSIFLSASIPVRPGFRRVSSAAFEIEEAVISLTRAVLREEGVLVFGAHPSISPLVASVASEYIVPRLRTTEPPEVESIGEPERTGPGVVIYQSHAYDGHLPDKTWQMYRFGYADLVWCAAQAGEKFDPKNHRTQCPRSLLYMRQQMFAKESPAAMIAIGGMEGVVAEAELFIADQLRRHASGDVSNLYLVENSGGATELLARQPPWLSSTAAWAHRVESEWLFDVGGDFSERRAHPDPRARAFVPYPLIMQWLVQQIAKEPPT
jgi:hypothetical protein